MRDSGWRSACPKNVDFDAQPLRINGKPVSAERESSTTISAPLTDQDLNETFVLELRYRPSGTPDQLDLPWLPDEPAVQKVYLCTYLPEKQVLLASAGSWTDELSGTGPLELRLSPASPADEARLINEITEDNPSCKFGTHLSHRQVAAVHLLHLRPEDAPDGSLQLRTMDRKLFNGLVVVIIAVAGLPLFRGSLRLQLALLLMLRPCCS